MKNLLKADFFHILKDKSMYVLMAVVFVLPLITCIMFGSSISVEKLIFTSIGTDMFCAIMGITLSFVFGKDYSQNTIRNKICYGNSKYKVIFSFFIEAVVITLAFALVALISSLIFGAIFTNLTFTADFVAKLCCQLLILIAYGILVTAFVISTKSMKVGFFVTIIFSVILTAISAMLPKMTNSGIAMFFSRVIYSSVSTMLVSSSGDVFGIFGGIYLNAILVSIVYILLSMVTTILIVRKQNYK